MLTNYYFDEFRKLIYDNSGITISDTKKYFLESRIKEHLSELGISSLKHYFLLLKNNREVFRDFISKILFLAIFLFLFVVE